jgi:phosphatidylserine/phosphatidylglycerophosphate/cardiolipin synthase-like enzyme
MKKLSYFLLLLVLLKSISASTNFSSKESFFLLPKEKELALQNIYKSIDHASSTINISIYSFTHKKIAKKLKNAAKRGVKIEIIFDAKSTKSQKGKSMLYYLAKYKNISVYKLKGKLSKNKKYHGIMHMKMAVIDHKKVIFGSANWTYSAFSNNYELLYMTKNYAIAKKFEKIFQTLKKEALLYR